MTEDAAFGSGLGNLNSSRSFTSNFVSSGDTTSSVPVGGKTAPTRPTHVDCSAEVQPLTAEEESWGQWSWRHVFNSLLLLGSSFYQIVQVGWEQQPIDMKVMEFTRRSYITAPPRTAEGLAEGPRGTDSEMKSRSSAPALCVRDDIEARL